VHDWAKGHSSRHFYWCAASHESGSAYSGRRVGCMKPFRDTKFRGHLAAKSLVIVNVP